MKNFIAKNNIPCYVKLNSNSIETQWHPWYIQLDQIYKTVNPTYQKNGNFRFELWFDTGNIDFEGNVIEEVKIGDYIINESDLKNMIEVGNGEPRGNFYEWINRRSYLIGMKED